MVVEEIMTEAPVCAQSSTSIQSVIATLFEQEIRHVPIVDGHLLVGIVSDRDLRGFLAPAMLEFEKSGEIRRKLGQPISSVMNTDVVSVTPETELSEVVDILIEEKVGAVPVVRPGTQELVGIVSYVDVLRAAQKTLND